MQKTRLLFILINMVLAARGYGQSVQPDAMAILDKALGPITGEKPAAIYFEAMVYSVKEPLSIFTLPAYQVYRGGFLYSDGKKFELQLGLMKGLSDGKLLVVIDEGAKTMYVDSVRLESLIKGEQAPDMGALFRENVGDCNLTYVGKEVIQTKKCHKIQSVCIRKGEEINVLYWVDVQSGALVLMSESQHALYNVYWIKNAGLPPVNHDYTVRLPKTEMDKFHGYEVFDHRFASDVLKPIGKQ